MKLDSAGVYRNAVLVTAALASCAPLNDRAAGRLEVTVIGLAPTVDRLSIDISVASSRRTFDVTPVDGAGNLVVETLPAGAVVVAVEAFIGDSLAGSRTAIYELTDGQALQAAIDFSVAAGDGGQDSDAGVGPIVSAPIEYATPVVDESDLGGDRLTVDVSGGSSAFSQFISNATSALGRTPSIIRLRAASLSLGLATGPVVGLDDLFVSADLIVKSDAIDVKMADIVPTSAVSQAFVVVGEPPALASITEALVTSSFELRVRGDSPRSEAEAFSVRLTLEVTYEAE